MKLLSAGPILSAVALLTITGEVACQAGAAVDLRDSGSAKKDQVFAKVNHAIEKEYLASNKVAAADATVIEPVAEDTANSTVSTDKLDTASLGTAGNINNNSKSGGLKTLGRKPLKDYSKVIEQAKENATPENKIRLDKFGKVIEQVLSNPDFIHKSFESMKKIFPNIKTPQDGIDEQVKKFLDQLKTDPKAADNVLDGMQSMLKNSNFDLSDIMKQAKDFGMKFNDNKKKEKSGNEQSQSNPGVESISEDGEIGSDSDDHWEMMKQFEHLFDKKGLGEDWKKHFDFSSDGSSKEL